MFRRILQRNSRIDSTTSSLSMYFSYIILGSISLLLPFPFIYAAYIRIPDRIGVMILPIYLILLLFALIFSIFSSLIISRLLIRTVPLPLAKFHLFKIDANSLFWLIIFGLITELLIYLIPFLAYYHFLGLSTITELRYFPYQIRGSFEWIINLFRSIIIISPIVILIIFPICIFRNVISNWGKIYNKKFILFLRRFSSSADHIASMPILSGVPKGTHIVMMDEEFTKVVGKWGFRNGGNWNPLVIGFFGFNIKMPITSIPIYVQSTNQYWKYHIKELMIHSSCIIIDLSEISTSVSTELSLIRDLRLKSKTIFIKESSSRLDIHSNNVYQTKIETNEFIFLNYSLSWRRAMLPILFVFLLYIIASIIFWYVLTPLLNLLTGWDYIITILFYSLFYFLGFIKSFRSSILWPSMSKEAKKKLHNLISNCI